MIIKIYLSLDFNRKKKTKNIEVTKIYLINLFKTQGKIISFLSKDLLKLQIKIRLRSNADTKVKQHKCPAKIPPTQVTTLIFRKLVLQKLIYECNYDANITFFFPLQIITEEKETITVRDNIEIMKISSNKLPL